MEEIWKTIEGFEGLYEVSNLGRVRSLDRVRKAGYGSTANVKGKILTPQYLKGTKYSVVTLCRNEAGKHYLIHRLVATAFIDNPYNLPEVNHKDENPSNNNVSNLEWCDRKYNNNYGTARDRASRTRGKVVVQYDIEGNEISRYWSAREAARQIGKSQAAISRCCLGEYKSAYGYIWKYDKS